MRDAAILGDRTVFARNVDALPGDPSPFLLVTAGATRSSRRPGRPASVQGFATEQEARSAFIAARLSSRPSLEWAELVARRPNGRLRTLAWFGPEVLKPDAPATAAVAEVIAPSASPRRRLPGVVDRLRRR